MPTLTSAAAPLAHRPARSHIRWNIVFLAFLGTAISYVDRANMGVAVPYIQRELGLDDKQMGWVLGAFFWTYAALQLPSGWFVDRVGARIAYAAAVIWWSAFTAATALARGIDTLFGARLLLGVGEAPAYPCNAKAVSEWFPRKERAFATAIFDSGARVGTALSLPIVTALIAKVGWRGSFVVTGVLGVLWTVVWVRMYRSPRQHPGVSAAELAHIESDHTNQPAHDSGTTIRWANLFRHRAVLGMMLGFFCLNFVIYFFITWFPSYLVKGRGFSAAQLASYGSLPPWAAVVGGWLGGLTSDRLVRAGVRLTWARKLPIVGGLVLASSIGLAVLVQSAAAAVALLALSYAGLAFAGASVWSLPADVAPSKRHVASIGGIQNFASNLAGVCISLFVGVMVERTGSYVTPLLTAGGFALLGACSYLFVVGEIKPLGDRLRAPSP